MAEKGILVEDAASGESVAARDASETDNDGNARIIQRVDVCKGKLPTPFIDAANLIRADKNSGDGQDESSNNFDAYENTLLVGDKSTLVVQVQAESLTSGVVEIAPILVEDDGTTMQGFLASQSFDFGNDDYIILASNTYYVSSFMTWDVTGGHKIALCIYEWSDSYTTINVYGAII